MSGMNMAPTITNGKKFMIESFDHNYARGSIIVFKETQNGSAFLDIQRVIGLPGDVVNIHDGLVFVNGVQLNELSYLGDISTSGTSTVSLGANQYFTMGDNRKVSYDSREIGPIDGSQIVGTYWFSL